MESELNHLNNGALYTLVQHSGFGYSQDPRFKLATEERSIPNKRTLKAIKNRGGMVFIGYVGAATQADIENYPPNVKGIIPHALGTFDKYKIDGLKLYIPGKNNVENTNTQKITSP